jgi:hypothetical protein
MGIVDAIKGIGALVDVVGPELGLSEEAIAKIDVGISAGVGSGQW